MYEGINKLISEFVRKNLRRAYVIFNDFSGSGYHVLCLSFCAVLALLPEMNVCSMYVQGGPKRKPLPRDQKIVLNRIKACQWC